MVVANKTQNPCGDLKSLGGRSPHLRCGAVTKTTKMFTTGDEDDCQKNKDGSHKGTIYCLVSSAREGL